MVCLNTRGARLAGFHIQAGGHIDRQNRCMARVEGGNPTCHAAIMGAASARIGHGYHRCAQAKQRINAKVKFFGWLHREGNSCAHSPLPGRFGILWRVIRVAKPCHDRCFSPLPKVHRGLKTIATVVTWPAGQPDGLRMRSQRQAQPGDCQACLLHQGMGWQFRLGSLLNLAGRSSAEKRQGQPYLGTAIAQYPLRRFRRETQVHGPI